MKVWWVGWEFPYEHANDERIAAVWPPGVKGWRSGYGEDTTTWCGRVEAESEDAAKEKILSMYGELAEHVIWRWDPEEKPAGWQPESRFPEHETRLSESMTAYLVIERLMIDSDEAGSDLGDLLRDTVLGAVWNRLTDEETSVLLNRDQPTVQERNPSTYRAALPVR